MASTTTEIKEAVRQQYAAIARGEVSGCGCNSRDAEARANGYTQQDIEQAGIANLGLGCGNPLAIASLKPGMTVLDLGSGAGFDAFLAWKQVGPTGLVIGVDMTDDMLTRARENATRLGATNVEFRKGFIENLPVEDNSVDFVISNCVINLSTSKADVFREIRRVLKPGGKFSVADIVLLEELPESVKNDVQAYVGCLAGATLMHEYVGLTLEAGLTNLSIPRLVYAPADAPQASSSSCCSGGTRQLKAASIVLQGNKPE